MLHLPRLRIDDRGGAPAGCQAERRDTGDARRPRRPRRRRRSPPPARGTRHRCWSARRQAPSRRSIRPARLRSARTPPCARNWRRIALVQRGHVDVERIVVDRSQHRIVGPQGRHHGTQLVEAERPQPPLRQRRLEFGALRLRRHQDHARCEQRRLARSRPAVPGRTRATGR